MATLKRYYRTQVDAAPNQMVTAANEDISIGLKELTVENPSGNGTVYASLYQETSGSVTVGTTTPKYGPKPISDGSTLLIGCDSESTPLAFFNGAITVCITTTPTGSTSPTSDCRVEIQAWGGS